jgi:hypothetical protein
MDSSRRIALWAGVLFLITFATSIPALGSFKLFSTTPPVISLGPGPTAGFTSEPFLDGLH